MSPMHVFWGMAAGLGLGFGVGYDWPRDVEIESIKPLEFRFEVTREAARELAIKSSNFVKEQCDVGE